MLAWLIDLVLAVRFRRPRGLPSSRIEIQRTLRNGVTLELAEVYEEGVKITWSRRRSVPLGQVWEQAAAWSPEQRRSAERRRRENGLVFDAPLLKLQRQGSRRFVGGDLSGAGNDQIFRGDAWFPIRRRRLGDQFTLKCVDERVGVTIPPA